MRRPNSVLLLAAVFAISNCSKEPDKIAAVPMEDSTYSSYSCSNLQKTKLDLSQSLDSLSASQKQAATNDAWGVFLIGLPVARMSGSDQETAIAVTKGKIDAVDRQLLAKHCR